VRGFLMSIMEAPLERNIRNFEQLLFFPFFMETMAVTIKLFMTKIVLCEISFQNDSYRNYSKCDS